MVQITFGVADEVGMVMRSSLRSCMSGVTLRMLWERAMYSASVVERTISDWSLEAQRMGHPQ